MPYRYFETLAQLDFIPGGPQVLLAILPDDAAANDFIENQRQRFEKDHPPGSLISSREISAADYALRLQEQDASLLERFTQRDPQAPALMLRHNLHRAIKLALDQNPPSGSLMDLITAANQGLREATQSFDPQHGLPPSAFADQCIQKRMDEALAGRE